MIKYASKNIKNWYFRDHKLLHLHDYKCCSKPLLIFSNLIYIIILLLLIRLEIKNKWFIIILFISIFFISTIYHYYQCYSPNYNNYTMLKYCDIISIFVFVFLTFLFYKIKINFKIIILFIISLIIWNRQDNKKIYIYTHSLWHILSGITLFFIFYELKYE